MLPIMVVIVNLITALILLIIDYHKRNDPDDE